MAKRRRVGNVVYQFPDDATEQEIAESLNAKYQQGPPNAGLAGVSRPVDPILRDSRDPRSAVYQDSPFHESTSAENLAGWVDEGPIKTGQGVKEMVTPGTFKRGVHDAISGAGTTAAPATAFAPPAAVVRSAIGGYLGSKAGEAGAKSWGADEDTTQMVSDLGGVAGGYVGYKAPDIATSPVRAAGRVIQRATSMPDLPVNTPSRSANIFSKVANASRGVVSRGGRSMANYKIPPAPNVFKGDTSGGVNGILPGEPDLPTPVKPDGVAHHNDVTDELELNKLLDQVSQQPEVRQGRDPVRTDGTEHHDDISPKYAAVDGTTTKMTGPLPKLPQVPSRMFHGTTADRVPSILDDGLSPNEWGRGPFITDDRSVASTASKARAAEDLGSDAPWQSAAYESDYADTPRAILDIDVHHPSLSGNEDDAMQHSWDLGSKLPANAIKGVSYDPPIRLPESPLTKSFSADDVPTPNSDALLRAIKSAPGWPENGLPNEPWDRLNGPDLDTDPYNRVDDIEASQPRRRASDRPFRRSTDTSTGSKVNKGGN